MYSSVSNLNSIRVFEAAARLGSFKAAAEELHLTPTAVSHQIRKLEAQLDVALFERKTRAVHLTGAGLRLADAARLSLQTLADTLEELSTQSKTLTVSTTTSFAALWLVPRLGEFRSLYPDLEVVIQTGEQRVNLQRDRQVDIAIRYGQCPEAEEAELLVREEFGIYGTADRIQQLTAAGPVTLFETEWKYSRLPAISAAQWLRLCQPGWKKVLRQHFDQELHVIQAAMAGQGLAFVSNLLVESAVQHGWLQPYRSECRLPGFGYYLVASDQRRQTPKVERFRGWLSSRLLETSQ